MSSLRHRPGKAAAEERDPRRRTRGLPAGAPWAGAEDAPDCHEPFVERYRRSGSGAPCACSAVRVPAKGMARGVFCCTKERGILL